MDKFPFKLKDDEQIKNIKEFPDYWISNYGNVFSYKTNRYSRKGWKKLIPTIHNGYVDYRISMNNIHGHLQAHRYVALYFCKGYSSELVVNHIDANKKNNYYKNLEWVTIKENVNKGYITSKKCATRNYNTVILLDSKFDKIKEFIGVKNLRKYIEENNLDASWSSLGYYGKSRNFYIIKFDKNKNIIPCPKQIWDLTKIKKEDYYE